MTDHIHKLSKKTDEWFLEQHQVDGILQTTFEEGNEIVVCEVCHRVWMASVWESSKGCPSRGCKSEQTVEFSRSVFQLKSDPKSRIKIKSRMQEIDDKKNPVREKYTRKRHQGGWTRNLRRGLGVLTLLLFMVVLVLLVNKGKTEFVHPIEFLRNAGQLLAAKIYESAVLFVSKISGGVGAVIEKISTMIAEAAAGVKDRMACFFENALRELLPRLIKDLEIVVEGIYEIFILISRLGMELIKELLGS